MSFSEPGSQNLERQEIDSWGFSVPLKRRMGKRILPASAVLRPVFLAWFVGVFSTPPGHFNLKSTTLSFGLARAWHRGPTVFHRQKPVLLSHRSVVAQNRSS